MDHLTKVQVKGLEDCCEFAMEVSFFIPYDELGRYSKLESDLGKALGTDSHYSTRNRSSISLSFYVTVHRGTS